MNLIHFTLLAAVADQAKVRSVARAEQILLVLVLALVVAGAVWLKKAYARKKQQDRKEQHLKSYILEDPKMRDLYLESRKQGKGEQK